MYKNFCIITFLFLFMAINMPVVEAAKTNTNCSLQFVSTPSKEEILPEGQLSYQYSIKNTGSSTCVSTSVSLYYAENEKYVNSTLIPTASDYYWFIGKLAPGESFLFSVVIQNMPNDNNQMFGEACASANGAQDACVKTPVAISAGEKEEGQEGNASSVAISDSGTANFTQAWIYPGDPACNAVNEYSDGRVIDTLKPEYYQVQSDGTLRQKNLASDGCNGYSVDNVLDIKAHSTHQYATVSGDVSNVETLLSSATLQNSAINTLTNFAVSSGFTGIEIDWEGFGNWTATDYANYKKFITDLQNSLHSKGKLLMIDAPAISDSTYQGYFPFKYEDFTNIDYITIMAYDYQYDWGVGEPVAPEAWTTNIINWAKARLPIGKIIIGIPTYGYHGILGSYNITIDTYAQAVKLPGFSTRKPDSDGEETWMNGNVYYVVQATSTLDRKKDLIESMGIKNISAWHLGGNNWFTKN
jgi:spore germination protein YaaH